MKYLRKHGGHRPPLQRQTTFAEVSEAVRFYWETRSKQSQKQREAGGSDQGLRSAATGVVRNFKERSEYYSAQMRLVTRQA
jgi:hypothetical protein